MESPRGPPRSPPTCGQGSLDVEPVGEAARVVSAEHAVLEEAPAFGPVDLSTVHAGTAGNGTPHMVDDAEHHPARHLGGSHVVGDPLGELLAAPRAVRPVRVATVATTHVQRHGEFG